MAIIQVTSREFRDRQASMFALADNGNQVVIKRNPVKMQRQRSNCSNRYEL